MLSFTGMGWAPGQTGRLGAVGRDRREGFSEVFWCSVLPSLHSHEGLELIGRMGWKRTERSLGSPWWSLANNS